MSNKRLIGVVSRGRRNSCGRDSGRSDRIGAVSVVCGGYPNNQHELSSDGRSVAFGESSKASRICTT